MATEVNKILLELEVNSKGVITNLDQVEDKLKKVGTTASTVGKQFSNFGQAGKQVADASGIAGAAAAELGRTISDLPFGIQAITNNVSQLGSMFSLLVVRTGSFRNALTSLLKVFKGPAGILIIFQIAVAAVELLSRKTKKSEEDINKVNVALEAELKSLEGIVESFKDVNISEEERIKLLKQTDLLGKEVYENYRDQKLTAEEIVALAEQELIIKRAKKQLDAESETSSKRLQELEEELNDLSGEDEKIQRRINILKQKGLTEEEAINEVNQKRFNIIDLFLGRQKRTIDGAFSQVKLSEERKAIEEEINQITKAQEDAQKAITEALREQERIKREAQLRASAEEEFAKASFDLRRKIAEEELKDLEETGVQSVEQRKAVVKRILALEMARLESQRKEEIANIEDPDTIAAINKKFAKLAEIAAFEFKNTLEDIKFEPIEVGIKPVIIGKELFDGPKKTEAQKFAEKELGEYADNVVEGFQKRVQESGERDPFVDFFGFSQEKFQKSAENVQKGLDAAFGLIDAQFEKELALEERKTIALNDQLRERLRNEELTAQERDKINQEIAKNEAKLVEKQNEIEEKRFKLNKAQGIANAVINTAVAVTKVFPNIPMMAFIGALGAAQIATIASQQFVPTPMPAPTLTAQSGPSAQVQESLPPEFNVLGRSGINQLAETIEGQSRRPIKTYVVAGEVSTAQSLERNAVKEAGI